MARALSHLQIPIVLWISATVHSGAQVFGFSDFDSASKDGVPTPATHALLDHVRTIHPSTSALAEHPGLAPHLQPAGPQNGGAIRGVLGDCEADHGMYHGFVPKGEPYHCNMAKAELAFKNKYYPDEDLCDWGFGELIPHPQVHDGQVVWGPPGAEWAGAPGTAPGTTGPEKMFHDYMCAASNAYIGGATLGRLGYQALCKHGSIENCLPRFSNLSLTWPTSMGIYRITPQNARFFTNWRYTYHRPNIAFGNRNKYYAGWVRKVVRCADIPKKLLEVPGKIATAEAKTPGFFKESSLEFATRTWRSMESLLTVDNLAASFSSPADWASSSVEKIVQPRLNVSVAGGQVRLTIAGMADRWFGIGFNASRMSEHPHAVIVSGSGAISERTLATYHGGVEMELQFKEMEHTVISGIRTVVLTREAVSKDPSRFSFPGAGQELRYIWSVGIGSEFWTHEQCGPAELEVQGSGAVFV